MTSQPKSGRLATSASASSSFNVTKLNLSGSEKNEKLSVIGNLRPYRNLVQLNLSANEIEKIENLDTLIHLKQLNLAGNRICKLEGLENCTKLTTLNVSFNLISSIPTWISKKLALLKSFQLAGNKIREINQLARLHGLSNLTVLSFRDNPALEQLSSLRAEGSSENADDEELYRLFVLYQFPRLVQLDDQSVTSDELEKANKRFIHVDMRKKLRDLGRSSSCSSSSTTERSKADTKLTTVSNPPRLSLGKTAAVGTSAQQHEQETNRIETLERELRLKDNLLRTRSDELARACLKHFELEQELAFHKIDTKMAAFLLGPRPNVESESLNVIDSTGEQPYIGRCRSRILSTSFRDPRFRSHEQLRIRPCQSVDQLSASLPHRNSSLTVENLNFGTDRFVQDFHGDPFSSYPKLFHQSTPTGTIGRPSEPNAPQISADLRLPYSNEGSLLSPSDDRPRSAPLRAKHLAPVHPDVQLRFGRDTVRGSIDLLASQPNLKNQSITRQIGPLDSTQSALSLHDAPNTVDSHTPNPSFLVHQGQTVPLAFQQQHPRQFGSRDGLSPNQDGWKLGQSHTKTSAVAAAGAAPIPSHPPDPVWSPESITGSSDLAAQHSPISAPQRYPKGYRPVGLTGGGVKLDHGGPAETIDQYHSFTSPPMQHSTASSRPSSRTTGTGRSANPSAEANASTWHMPQGLVLDSVNCRKERDQAAPPLKAHIHFSSVGSRNQFTHTKGSLIREMSQDSTIFDPGYSNCLHSSLDMGDSSRRKRSTHAHSSTLHLDPTESRGKDTAMYGIVRQPNRSTTRLKPTSPPLSDTSSDGLSGAEATVNAATLRRPTTHRPPHGPRVIHAGVQNGRRAVRKSGRRVTSPTCGTKRREGGSVFGEHTEQLLDLLIVSREACASEMRKMRADLARMQHKLPHTVEHSDDSYSAPIDRAGFRGINMETTNRVLSYNRPAGPSRCATQSFVDTWTTVTRPSPNDPEDEDPFGSPDEFSVKPFPKCGLATNQWTPADGRPRRMLPQANGADNETENENGESARDHVSYHDDVHPKASRSSRPMELVPASNHGRIRGRSLDPKSFQPPSSGSGRPRDTALLNGEEDEASTETVALANLTEELVGLRQGLKRARQLNSNRLELALKHMSTLELELQRQRCLTHEVKNAHERQAERARWERRLTATLSELKQCQASITEMRSQMDALQALRGQSSLEQQQTELQQTRAALDAQKEEITRLNRLLNRLLGIGPDAVSSDDLAQIQAALVELTRRMQLDTAEPNNPTSVRRAQSWLTGLAPGTDRSLPGLSQMTRPGQLICNVPEHHYLEDYMDELQSKIDEMSAQHREHEKKLNQSAKSKKKLEKRLEEQTTEIDRLNTDAAAKREELLTIKAELRSATEAKQAEQNKQHDRLATLASDLAQIESTVSSRREELTRLEAKLKLAEAELQRCQTQTQDATTQRDSALEAHRRSKLDLDAIQSELREAKEQMRQRKQDLKDIRLEIDEATNSKRQLQNVLHESGQTIRERESEFQRLTNSINESEARLRRIEADLTAGEQRLETQKRNLSEQDEILRNKKSELSHLTQQIGENQKQADRLTRDMTDQRSALDQLKQERAREAEQAATQARQMAAKVEQAQRELAELQTSIKSLEEEKRRVQLNREGGYSTDRVLHVAQEDSSLQRKRVTLETEISQLVQERDSTRHQLESLRNQLDNLKRQETETLEAISSSKRELSKIRQNIDQESNGLDQLKQQRISSQTEQDQLSQLMKQRQSELAELEHRVSSAKSAMESQETSLEEQKRERTKLSEELGRLNQATHFNRAAQRAAAEARETSENLLQTTLNHLDRSGRELHNVEQRLNNGQQQLKSLDDEIANKSARLNELKAQVRKMETELSHLQRTESRVMELEKALVEATRSQTARNPNGSTDLHTEVTRLKTALAQSQRDFKHLKRRSTRDLSELERIAEEQCSRAGDLSEQLLLLKRQYAQLKGQISTYGMLMDEVITIASQTELSEHGKRLEAALTAARAELEQNSCVLNTSPLVIGPIDPLRTGSAPDIGHLEEQKHYHTASVSGELASSLGQLTNPTTAIGFDPASNLNSMRPGPAQPPPAPHLAELYSRAVVVGRVSNPLDAYELASRTGMTTATSGLGSSLIPTTNGSTQDGATVLPTDEQQTTGANQWKRQLITCVADQKERVRTEKRKKDVGPPQAGRPREMSHESRDMRRSRTTK